MTVLQLIGVLEAEFGSKAAQDYLLAEIWVEGGQPHIRSSNAFIEGELREYLANNIGTTSIAEYRRQYARDGETEYFMTTTEPVLPDDPGFLESVRDSFTYRPTVLAGYVVAGLACRIVP